MSRTGEERDPSPETVGTAGATLAAGHRAARAFGDDATREGATPTAVYGPLTRRVSVALLAISAASIPTLIALVVFGTDVVFTPEMVIRTFIVVTVLPVLATWLIIRASMGSIRVEGALLVIRRRDLRIEVPCAAIARIVPWIVPVPGAGLTVRMRSGRRLRHRLQPCDPAALLGALADRCGVDDARRALGHATVVYAAAKRLRRPARWYHLVGKYPLFALLPTAVLFNAHQHIAYGALLGEYYLLGLGSWLTTLAVYWATLTIYLVLFAAVWRGLAETIALGTAWVARSRAPEARRITEAACRILYYGGVPILLVLRFLP